MEYHLWSAWRTNILQFSSQQFCKGEDYPNVDLGCVFCDSCAGNPQNHGIFGTSLLVDVVSQAVQVGGDEATWKNWHLSLQILLLIQSKQGWRILNIPEDSVCKMKKKSCSLSAEWAKTQAQALGNQELYSKRTCHGLVIKQGLIIPYSCQGTQAPEKASAVLHKQDCLEDDEVIFPLSYW